MQIYRDQISGIDLKYGSIQLIALYIEDEEAENQILMRKIVLIQKKLFRIL